MQTKLPSASSELAQAAIKGAVSVIPVVGGLIAELGACLASPIDRRKREWMEEVEKALQQLSRKYNKLPQDLSDDPAFVTALLKATAAALGTHRQEKIEALRRFLVAVGSRTISDEELQYALFRLIDDFSVGHMEVLRFLEADYSVIAGAEKLEIVYGRYHYNQNGGLDRITFRWIIADLASKMVIHLGDIEDLNEYASLQVLRSMSDSKIRPLQITDLGRRLLDLLRGDA